MSDQTVIVRKMLPASCEEVYDAWLDPEGMSQWMCPGPVTVAEGTLEPRVGGHLRVVMSAPNAQFVNTGQFRVLERPSMLKFTWNSSRMGNVETLVTVEIFPRGSDCELVLTHERVPQTHSGAELQQGWGHILEKLGNHFVRLTGSSSSIRKG